MKKITFLFGATIGSAVGLGRYIAVTLYDSDRVPSMLIEFLLGIVAVTAMTAIVYFVRRFIYKVQEYAKIPSNVKINTANTVIHVVLICAIGFIIVVMYYILNEEEVSVLIDMVISIMAVAILFYKVFAIICEAECELSGFQSS